MNFEASRLRTFRSWPANAIVDGRRIAKAGFYYMGQGLEVQCFSCGGRISEWNYGDKVMTRHRWLDPRCPFVINPATSGNVPLEGSVSSSSSSSVPLNDQTDLVQNSPPIQPPVLHRTNSTLRTLYRQNEYARLQSYGNWPKTYIVTPESLARAGFFYTQERDVVKCAFCGVGIGRWEEGDDALNEHRRHFPTCEFVQRLDNQFNGAELCSVTREVDRAPKPVIPPDGVNIRSDHCQDVNMSNLGVQTHKVPKHPKYSMPDARLQTFINWPGDVIQTPEDLADAGFYYAGSGDQVRCFHCDGGLRMWDPNDDPWVEHARWYPDCGYISLAKGQSFINNAIKEYPPLDAEEIAQIEGIALSKLTDATCACQQRPTVSISESDLQELMSSPEVAAALQLGIEISRVKMAIRQRAEAGGLPFRSSEELINAALDVQLGELLDPDDAEAWSTPPSSPVVCCRRILNRIPNDTTSEDNTTEPEDILEYPANSNDIYSAPIEPPSASVDGNNCGDDMCDEGDETSTLAVSGRANSVSSLNITAEEGDIQKVSLAEENRRLKEARLCKICLDREVCIVFLPCGHLVTCVHCAHSLADCPLCRKKIVATVRTYLS